MAEQHRVAYKKHSEERPSSETTPTTTTTTTGSAWRKPGERLRAALIEQDEAAGGQAFVLSSSCPIHRYYQVADKVLDQFLHHPIDSRDELLEAYMVGHRLVKFLSSILPTHADYLSTDPEEADSRFRSQEQLTAVLKYLDQIAILVDKQEHEDFISSVLSNHGADNSEQEVSLRESSYYDGDDEDVSCQHSYAGGSDSTERLNNTTITSANTSTVISEQYEFVNSTPPSDLDRSTIADSVDEDPASTSGNTMLRFVDQQQQSRAVTSETSGASTTTSVASSPAVARPRAKKKWLPPYMPPPKPPPMQATPSVLSNRVTPQRQEDISMTESSIPGRLDTSNDGSLHVITPPTPSEEHGKQLSPGGTVRNKVRAWPPKPDPPQEGTPGGRFRVPIGQALSSSPEPSRARPERPSTPLPLEQHAIALTSPDTIQPLLQLKDSPKTVRLRFKPLTELQKEAERMDAESPYKKEHEPDIRHTWTDTQAPSIDAAKAYHAGFSSSSCSSNSFQDRDDEEAGSLFKYSSINSPASKKVTVELDRSRSAGQDEADARQESSSLENRKKSNLSTSRSEIAGTSMTRPYDASATDWRKDKDDLRAVESISANDGNNTTWIGNASVGSLQLGSQAHENRSGETKGSPFLNRVRQQEADAAVLKRARATREGVKSGKDVSVSFSQSKFELPSRSQELDMSTDSMGFPKPRQGIEASDQQVFRVVGGALQEEPNYQNMSRESSVFSKTPERQDTSTSSSAVSSRNSVNRDSSGGSFSSKDMLAARVSGGNTSFGFVDLNVNTHQPLSRVNDREVLTSQIKAQEQAFSTPTKRTPSSILPSDAPSSNKWSLGDPMREEICDVKLADIIKASPSDGKPPVPQKEPKFGVVRSRFQRIPKNLDISTESKGIPHPVTNQDKDSTDSHGFPEERREVDSSNSYAPSTAEWSIDEGSDYGMKIRNAPENSLLMPIDSMGFPAFLDQQNTSTRESTVFPSNPSARNSSSDNGSFISADKSVKGQDERSIEKITATWLTTTGKPYAAPETLVKGGSIGISHTQPIWPDVWNSRDAEPDRERNSSRWADAKQSDNSISSGYVNKEHGVSSRTSLSHEAWVQLWASDGQNPRSVSQATDTDPFGSGDSFAGSYVAPGQRVQRATSAERTVSAGSRSANRSRELGLQGDPFPDTMGGFGSTTTAMYETLSPSGGPLEAPILREELPSPFMIDSMAEQKLKLGLNVDAGHNTTPSSTVPQDVGLFGSLKSLQFSPPPILDLTLDRSASLSEKSMERGSSVPRRGTKMFCQKKKGVADSRSPNEQDTDDSSLLMVKNPRGQLFKNCARCLID